MHKARHRSPSSTALIRSTFPNTVRFQTEAIVSYLLFTLFTPTLGPTQPSVQWAPGAVSLEIKRSGRLGDHSHSSCAEIKNKWRYTTVRPYALTTTVKYIFKNHFNNIPQNILREILATNTINESLVSPCVLHFPPKSIFTDLITNGDQPSQCTTKYKNCSLLG